MTNAQICAVGVITLASVLLMKDAKAPRPELAVLVLAVIVAGRVLLSATQVVAFVAELSQGTGISDYVKTLLKAAGIAFTSDFTAELCRDAGENSVARYVELLGRGEIIVLMLPVVRDLLDISLGMLNV